jgi:hypothetical protein
MHGEVEWPTPEEGGRKTGLPLSAYAATDWRQDVGPDGIASFVLRGFDRTKRRSRAEARWLVPQAADEFIVNPGDVIVVSEGVQPVAHFFVDSVDQRSL